MIKFCIDAGILTTVDVGQNFVMGHKVSWLEQSGHRLDDRQEVRQQRAGDLHNEGWKLQPVADKVNTELRSELSI